MNGSARPGAAGVPFGAAKIEEAEVGFFFSNDGRIKGKRFRATLVDGAGANDAQAKDRNPKYRKAAGSKPRRPR